jgi:hypothetical protein
MLLGDWRSGSHAHGWPTFTRRRNASASPAVPGLTNAANHDAARLGAMPR